MPTMTYKRVRHFKFDGGDLLLLFLNEMKYRLASLIHQRLFRRKPHIRTGIVSYDFIELERTIATTSDDDDRYDNPNNSGEIIELIVQNIYFTKTEN